jgi:hypothetical protein
MPQTWTLAFQRRNRASASWTCTPRLLPNKLVPFIDYHEAQQPAASRRRETASMTGSRVSTRTLGGGGPALALTRDVSPLRAPAFQGCIGARASSDCSIERSVGNRRASASARARAAGLSG